MNIIVCKNYDEVSDTAAKIIAESIKKKPNFILGLATGSSPVGIYERLAELNKKGELDFSTVKTFNLDEYYPISKKNEQSYDYFMHYNLFSKINIKEENINIPNGETTDVEAECRDYDAKIKESGGIDLQVLGIGGNGHIAFNEPDDKLIAPTHATPLTEETRIANSRFFDSIDDVPTHALTMGMYSILNAKKIVLVANGKGKHEAIKALKNDEITTKNPATFLKLHPDATIICDEEAYYE